MKTLSVLCVSLLMLSGSALATTPASDHEPPACDDQVETCTNETENNKPPSDGGNGFGGETDDSPSVDCDFRC